MNLDTLTECGKPRLVSRTQRCGKQGNLSVKNLDARTQGFVEYEFVDIAA